MTPATAALSSAVLSFRPHEASIHAQVDRIYHETMRRLGEPDFTAIHPKTLADLFEAYDERFFSGLLRRALDGRPIEFRLSQRMTRSGGKTTRFRSPSGETSFEIAIAVRMLFDAFQDADRQVSVCGHECGNRLQAMQRIFEHELVHLVETLCWDESDCAAPRFQDIAARYFLHRAHTHALVTRRERAAVAGIRVGSRVRFDYDGRALIGRVNRITQRVTVLVEDPEGPAYSDGRRYKTYYVPIRDLQAV
jgi:hypothetical protein